MCGVLNMTVSYNRLWKLLIDKKMTKLDLRQITGLVRPLLLKWEKDVA
jgi:DNA-binding Xre family transcriptional regulator